ncbi:MAG: hypothetical protein QN178_00440 [Armatimonadota bacterium]|nr:hypothetical protein [Armatimonadota bacterium]
MTAGDATLKDQIKKVIGQRVTLTLAHRSGLGPTLTGRLLGAVDAADGLVVTVEPETAAGVRRTIHYHDILAVTPESSKGVTGPQWDTQSQMCWSTPRGSRRT